MPELSDSGSWNLLADRLQRGDTVALPAYGAAVLKSVKTRVRAATPEDEILYHIFVRSFRDSDGDRIGDLRGITEKLGYIQDLGATSILLTPINPSPFYHNYFASSFEGVDRDYGDLAAYRELVQAVHARGMKIYLDQEIQYVAEDHPWLRQSLGQPRSEYGRYVLYNGAGNTKPEPGIFDLSVVPVYNGDRFAIATVNLHGAEVRGYFEALFGAMVDPDGDGRFDDGADGFRIDHMMDDLDLKGKLKDLFARFWAPVFAHARGINPRVKFVAEQYDWTYGDDFLTRGGTDMVFAFPIRNAIVSFQRRGYCRLDRGDLAPHPGREGTAAVRGEPRHEPVRHRGGRRRAQGADRRRAHAAAPGHAAHLLWPGAGDAGAAVQELGDRRERHPGARGVRVERERGRARHGDLVPRHRRVVDRPVRQGWRRDLGRGAGERPRLAAVVLPAAHRAAPGAAGRCGRERSGWWVPTGTRCSRCCGLRTSRRASCW